MNFTISTKPLLNALNLGVINSNISSFHQKSTMAQLRATDAELTINLESDCIITELNLRGSGTESQSESIFIDCLKFKQLINTLDTDVTTLEFTESGIIVHSGKSKFTLPKMLDQEDMSFNRPVQEATVGRVVNLNKDSWKFIQDHQMYCISVAYIHPAYTHVYMGEDGDVIVGDFDHSIFTHSKKGQLGKTCLLSDTIINMFNTLPENTTLVDTGTNYLVSLDTDAFTLRTQFTPKYETDPDAGSYNSEIILNVMSPNKDSYITIDRSALSKFLTQSDLLATSNDSIIKMDVNNGIFTLVDDSVDCKVAVKGDTSLQFNIEFKGIQLKSLISNMDGDIININPVISDDEVSGIVVWTETMEAMLAGVE